MNDVPKSWTILQVPHHATGVVVGWEDESGSRWAVEIPQEYLKAYRQPVEPRSRYDSMIEATAET